MEEIRLQGINRQQQSPLLADGHISNVNLRMLVCQVTVHHNEDKSIDICFDMNSAFNYKIMEDVTTDIL
ncbi:MAG: hypothetical protein J6I47_08725 [Ruminococcus sp.]|nr:hypothetical protein [Ruminococcus sp.]